MDPTFKNVYLNVLVTACPSCHMMGGVIGSPDLTSMETAYTSMIDKDATAMQPGQCMGKGKLIVPGDCEKSLLYNKLSQATPVCGRRMPLSSMTTPQSSLDLLCAWIKAGAKNN